MQNLAQSLEAFYHMNRTILLTLTLLIAGSFAFTDKENDLPISKTKAFDVGERLEYRFHYGVIDAGRGVLSVDQHDKKIRGREVYRIVGDAKSNRLFDFFYKVRDHYESYIDTERICSMGFAKHLDEGGYIDIQDYTFYQDEGKVDNGEGELFDVPTGTQDIISTFYKARTIDFSDAQPGDKFSLPTFIDNEFWHSEIVFLGRETLKIRSGKYKCIKIAPIVQKGRVFRNKAAVVAWITDDENKVLVRAKADVIVGSVKADLISYSGLAHPVAKVE